MDVLTTTASAAANASLLAASVTMDSAINESGRITAEYEASFQCRSETPTAAQLFHGKTAVVIYDGAQYAT
jgi:hypothetical protein